MKTDEYLEDLFKDSFDREQEVNENVARTLPFFAATLALAATLFSFIVTAMPPFGIAPVSLLLHALLALAGGLMAWILWQLLQAVRERQYRIPPKETELTEWAAELRAHFDEQGLKPTTVDARVLEQLRKKMIEEYAKAAEHNREANKPKLSARAQGFTTLVYLLGIAFLMIGIIFVSDRAAEPKGSDHVKAGSSQPRTVREEAAAGSGQPAAAGAEVSDHLRGREDPGAAGGEHGQQVSGDAKSGSQPAQPAPVQTQQQSKPLPAAPAHQVLRKSESDGGPLTKRD